jgi:signal transduction histidine kinase
LVLLWWLANLVMNRRQRADRRRLEHAVADRTSELEASQQTLRRLGEHNTRVLEEERKRIARELHDEMGQQLAALRMEASVLKAHARSERPPAMEHFQLLLDRIDQLAGGLRALVKQLRPPALDGGLAAALEWLASECTKATGTPCRTDVDTAADSLVPDTATQVFRVAQESLNNVRRHSQAAHVNMALRRDAAGWMLTVTDDGAGFDPSGDRSGHGLLGMEERARLLGGSVEIDSAPGAGTTVRLRFAAAAAPAATQPDAGP